MSFIIVLLMIFLKRVNANLYIVVDLDSNIEQDKFVVFLSYWILKSIVAFWVIWV